MYKYAALVLSLLTFQASAFDAKSKAGQKLMKNARKLENNQERDVSWMPNYSIKFESCHSLIQVAGEEGQGGGEDGSMLFTQHLIEFKLCPTGTCSTGCQNGGRYITNMQEFTQMYLQYKEEEKEQKCEQIRENCYNDDENYCFYQAGADECIENENDQEDEDIERYMECQELEMGDNQNNNNYNWNNNGGDNNWMYRQYYVGPKCSSNGKSINLALFLDAGCSVAAESGVYEKISQGYSLPYSTESMIGSDCISCEEVDEDANNKYYNQNNNNNNNNNQDEEPEIKEMCEMSYENAGRCEDSMSIMYPDNTACQFIKELLPKMESATRSVMGGSSSGVAVGLAWTFGILACVLGFYSFLLYRRLRRSKVSLNAETEGSLA